MQAGILRPPAVKEGHQEVINMPRRESGEESARNQGSARPQAHGGGLKSENFWR